MEINGARRVPVALRVVLSLYFLIPYRRRYPLVHARKRSLFALLIPLSRNWKSNIQYAPQLMKQMSTWIIWKGDQRLIWIIVESFQKEEEATASDDDEEDEEEDEDEQDDEDDVESSIDVISESPSPADMLWTTSQAKSLSIYYKVNYAWKGISYVSGFNLNLVRVKLYGRLV